MTVDCVVLAAWGLQVLVSLQSMVFVDDPYFNEPGYESSRSTPCGQQKALAYNQHIRLETARHAILAALQRPDPAFKEALQLHFSLKQQAMKAMLELWLKEAGSYRSALMQMVTQVLSHESDPLQLFLHPQMRGTCRHKLVKFEPIGSLFAAGDGEPDQ